MEPRMRDVAVSRLRPRRASARRFPRRVRVLVAGGAPPRPTRSGAPTTTPPPLPRRMASWLALSALLHAAVFAFVLPWESRHDQASLRPIPIAWVHVEAVEPDAGGSAASARVEPAAVAEPAPAQPAPKPRPARERRERRSAAAAPASAAPAAPPVEAPAPDGAQSASAEESPDAAAAVATSASLSSVGTAHGNGVGFGSAAGVAPGWMPRGGAQPAPRYPDAARRRGAQGIAQITLRLAANGHVSEVRVHRSSGDTRLDDAALAAVRRWRFDTPPPGADWAERWFVVPIEFRLQ